MDLAAELKELMLRAPRLTLAAAESLTAGHVQARIAAVSGASDYFRGGITAYTLEQKARHLGVDRAHAASVNCVSARVAEEMARGACALFGADVAVATTGYAEPSPVNGAAAPMAFWALVRLRGPGPAATSAPASAAVRSGRVEFPGASRTEVQARVAEAVLRELVAYLREVRG